MRQVGIDRRAFLDAAKPKKVKIQVGARGRKVAADWTAIDLFDTSEFIDHNWDLLDLPLEDESVDVFMCNAILEHVFEAQLAIHEMYRTLRVGGQIWVEVPFNQPYHAHPYDFRRWTIPGLQWEMRRFERLGSGVNNMIVREVKKWAANINRETKGPQIKPLAVERAEALVQAYCETAERPTLYAGTYFWGRKAEHRISDAERAYMSELRAEVKKELGQPRS